MKKRQAIFKKNDLLLFLCITALSLALMSIALIPKDAGVTVTVKVGGETTGVYPLSNDAEITVPSGDGGYNILVIEQGVAYIKDASCPDKLCMHQGKVSEPGQTLICLPNRVSVTVTK